MLMPFITPLLMPTIFRHFISAADTPRWPRRHASFTPPFSLSSAFAAIISRYFTSDTPIFSFHYFAMLLMLDAISAAAITIFLPLFLLMLISRLFFRQTFAITPLMPFRFLSLPCFFDAVTFAAFRLILSLFPICRCHFAMPLILRHYATPLAIDAFSLFIAPRHYDISRHADVIFVTPLFSPLLLSICAISLRLRHYAVAARWPCRYYAARRRHCPAHACAMSAAMLLLLFAMLPFADHYFRHYFR
jgi:hypothetical protein